MTFVIKRRNLPPVILITGCIVLLIAFSEQVDQTFQWDRTLILRGELWRLLTGHLVHCGFSHLFWDLSVFLAIGILLERYWGSMKFLCINLFLAFGISLGLLWFEPDLIYYRGLSGLDSGLFLLLLLTLVRSNAEKGKKTLILLLITAFTGKCLYEAVTGSTLFVTHYAEGFVALPVRISWVF